MSVDARPCERKVSSEGSAPGPLISRLISRANCSRGITLALCTPGCTVKALSPVPRQPGDLSCWIKAVIRNPL